MTTADGRSVALAAMAGAVALTAGVAAWQAIRETKALREALQEAQSLQKAQQQQAAPAGDEKPAYRRNVTANRDKLAGEGARWTKHVVLASPAFEELAVALQRRLGAEEFSAEEGPTISLEVFKSKDPNVKFNWKRVIGRKIIFIFDTVDQSRLFEQLSLLQVLQGFAVPDGADKTTKWKTYVDQGKYSWGRAASITVVLPWYRPCQMERTSRWSLVGKKWTNDDAEGPWLDVPTGQFLARLLSTPGSVPPLPGPSRSLDNMPLEPLWRPPLELMFVELHEEAPIQHCVSDLDATVRMARFVPYFLDKFRAEKDFAGKAKTFVVFPDYGAYRRYFESVVMRLRLDSKNILYIMKTRVSDKVEQIQKLFFQEGGEQKSSHGENPAGEKESFAAGDSVLIVDDFTNSGSTLFGAVNLIQKMAGDAAKEVSVTIFVSHLVATYDVKVVEGLKEKVTALGPKCRFVTTNTIPSTTNVLKGHPQVEVMDVADFLADEVQ